MAEVSEFETVNFRFEKIDKLETKIQELELKPTKEKADNGSTYSIMYSSRLSPLLLL